jgi:hypothetical protein
VRSAVALAAALLVLSGCGYEEDGSVAASPRETFELFVTAVVEGDAAAAGDLVSRELDEAERRSYIGAARRGIEPWGRGYRIIFEQVVGEAVAVVAAQGESHPGPGAYASVLVKDGDAWFVEPNRLQLVYGVSSGGGTAAAKPNVDFQVIVAGQDWRPEGRLWLDGNEVRLRHEPDAAMHRFAARVRRLHKRFYSAVAFARVDDRRGAIAWMFRAA